MTLAQLPGYYCAAWLVDKIGRKYTLSAFLLFSGVVMGLAHIELFGKPGFVIHTEFNDANGLQKGNSVRYVGVHVGKVGKSNAVA